MAELTPRTYNADPLRSYKFRVTVNGNNGVTISDLGFQSVSGLGHSVEVIEYREGGDPEFMKKLPGMSSFENLTLERGKYLGAQGADLLWWLKRVYDARNDSHNNDFRATVTITLHHTNGNDVACQWVCYQAWPVSYTVGDLQTSSSELLIDTVEIAYEFMTQTYFEEGSREVRDLVT